MTFTVVASEESAAADDCCSINGGKTSVIGDATQPGTIREQIMTTGASTAVARINAGQCACEMRNPQGSCCLGNVAATVKRIMLEMESVTA